MIVGRKIVDMLRQHCWHNVLICLLISPCSRYFHINHQVFPATFAGRLTSKVLITFCDELQCHPWGEELKLTKARREPRMNELVTVHLDIVCVS